MCGEGKLRPELLVWHKVEVGHLPGPDEVCFLVIARGERRGQGCSQAKDQQCDRYEALWTERAHQSVFFAVFQPVPGHASPLCTAWKEGDGHYKPGVQRGAQREGPAAWGQNTLGVLARAYYRARWCRVARSIGWIRR